MVMLAFQIVVPPMLGKSPTWLGPALGLFALWHMVCATMQQVQHALFDLSNRFLNAHAIQVSVCFRMYW